MMSLKNELIGIWTLRGSDYSGHPILLPVQIPCYVHPTLEKEHILPEMFWRKNAEQCQWVEEHTWEFCCVFDKPAFLHPDNAVLEFGGVDTFAEYTLNDTLLGASQNMFVSCSFRVDHLLKEKNNVLRVVIRPWREVVGDKPIGSAAFTGERVHVRRMQCTFFWDWVERFVSAGIWQPVYLYSPPHVKIDSLYCFTQSLTHGYASIGIHLQTKGALEQPCKFALSIVSPSGEVVWDKNGRVYMDQLRMQADIPNPALWWPVGYGEHPLYTVRAVLYDAHDAVCDELETEIGIRTVQFLYPTDQTGSSEEARSHEMQTHSDKNAETYPGEGMILVVNGEKIFAKGGNWVPPTPFPGDHDEELYSQLIHLAAEGNCNFLRVWGGGIYETDHFYSLCDKYGVMISQDFIFSCAVYPYDDAEFQEQIREEAEYAIRRLRNHPSLVFWSGNNENCDHYDWDDPNMPTLPLTEDVLIPCLDALDPTRPFRFGSPWGGKENGDYTVGDNHGSWWWAGAEKITPSNFDLVGRFTTESPFSGYPLPSTLKKFLSDEDICDPDSEITEYHIKNNNYFTEVLKWPSVHGRLIRNSEVMLGVGKSMEDRIYRSAYVQYEWARFTIEGARLAKWYSAALQFWMYNDCWPALGYAAVDYYGKPKAGWYAFKHSFAPITSTMRVQDHILTVTCLNDSLNEVSLEYRLLLADTKTGTVQQVKSGCFLSPANCNQLVTSVFLSEVGVDIHEEQKSVIIFCDLIADGVLINRSRWYPRWLSDLSFEPAELEYSVDRETCCVKISCVSGIAIGAALDGDCIFEDNFIDLLPGESKVIAYRPLPGFSGITPYVLHGGWNSVSEVFDEN